MRARMVTVGLIAAALVVLVRTTTGQVQPVPGPGSGIVTVQGEVDVRRLPLVEVGQRGDWKVSLASVADARVVSMPAVALARPAFVRTGARYDITWQGGDHEIIAVAQVADGSWVRTTVNGRDRWLNLALARAIEEVQ